MTADRLPWTERKIDNLVASVESLLNQVAYPSNTPHYRRSAWREAERRILKLRQALAPPGHLVQALEARLQGLEARSTALRKVIL